MWRHELINHLIKVRRYSDYLEIGLNDCNLCFNVISCKRKSGVDVKIIDTAESSKNVKLYDRCTSDDFFKRHRAKKSYDIIFVDGSHKEADVDKDIENSLKYLKDGGVVVMHDCLPPSKGVALERNATKGIWCGAVWRSVVKIRCSRNDLKLNVVDCDLGCGILEKGEQEVYKAHSLERCLDWKFFNKNKNDIFNVMSTEEFFNIYK